LKAKAKTNLDAYDPIKSKRQTGGHANVDAEVGHGSVLQHD